MVSRLATSPSLKNFATCWSGCGRTSPRSSGRAGPDEIVAAKPTAAYDAKFGAFVIDPGFFTRLVYEGV
jgi:hypothetical protein